MTNDWGIAPACPKCTSNVQLIPYSLLATARQCPSPVHYSSQSCSAPVVLVVRTGSEAGTPTGALGWAAIDTS